MTSRGYTCSLLPMDELEAQQALARQRTIARCVRMLDEGISVWHGIGAWYFDEARKVIAARDEGLAPTVGDPFLGRAA